MIALTLGCERYSRFAALLNEPLSATAATHFICWRFIP
jgi:hypothetical protein